MSTAVADAIDAERAVVATDEALIREFRLACVQEELGTLTIRKYVAQVEEFRSWLSCPLKHTHRSVDVRTMPLRSRSRSRPTKRGRALLLAAAALTALVLLAALGAIEAPAGSTWVAQEQQKKKSDQVHSVSCWSATGCMMVGYRPSSRKEQPLAYAWDGTNQRQLRIPTVASSSPELKAVSCWSARGCIAVGTYYSSASGAFRPLALRWNGSTWRRLSIPGDGIPYGVDCWSATGCMAVGSRDRAVAWRWNGRAWSLVNTPRTGASSQLVEISCGTANKCTAVGHTAHGALALRWSGRMWARDAIPKPASRSGIAGVSCWSATGCIAVSSTSIYGGTKIALRWDGTSWKRQATAPSPRRVTVNSVSCWSENGCIAVGSIPFSGLPPIADRWNGSSWESLDTSHVRSGAFWDVSCWSADECYAVGNSRDARWTKSAPPLPDPDPSAT